MGLKALFTEAGRQVKAVKITVDGVEHEVYVGKLTADQMRRVVKYIKEEDYSGMNVYLVQVGAYDDPVTRSYNDSREDTDIINKSPAQFVAAMAGEVIAFNKVDTEDATKN